MIANGWAGVLVYGAVRDVEVLATMPVAAPAPAPLEGVPLATPTRPIHHVATAAALRVARQSLIGKSERFSSPLRGGVRGGGIWMQTHLRISKAKKNPRQPCQRGFPKSDF